MRDWQWWRYAGFFADITIHIVALIQILKWIYATNVPRETISEQKQIESEQILLLPESIEEQTIIDFIDRNNGEVDRKKLLASYLFGKGKGAKFYDKYLDSLVEKERIVARGKNKTEQRYYII